MSEGNLLSYFNPDAPPTADYHDVSGDILLRKDSSSDVAMGFKSPDEAEKQQPGDDEIGDYIKQAKKRLSTKILNYEQSLPQSLPVPNEEPATSSAAESSSKSSPRGNAGNQPKKQGTVDFTYSADGDSPLIKPEILRQVSSPMMDKVLRQFSDNLLQPDDDSPADVTQYQKASPTPDLRNALKEIPSNFSKENQERVQQVKQRNPDANLDSDDDQVQRDRTHESGLPRPRKEKQKPAVDSQDVAVIAAMKAKKVANDSYLNEFPVVAGGKKKTAPDSDGEDNKNAGRKKKAKPTDSYLNEFPVVKASKEKLSEAGPARKLSKPRAAGGGDAYLNEFPVVHAGPRETEMMPSKPPAVAADKPGGVGSYRSRQIARREEIAKAREEVSGSSPQKGPRGSPARIPRPPQEKKRVVEAAVVLPRLVQSDQTEKRSAALVRKAAPGKVVASRDDSESEVEAVGARAATRALPADR
jgi:hypothetical protein